MDLRIALIEVGQFSQILKDNAYMKLVIDHENIKKCFCLLIDDGNVAVNVETGEEYEVIKRDDKGRITKEAALEAKTNVNYALYVKELDLNKLSSELSDHLETKAYERMLDDNPGIKTR